MDNTIVTYPAIDPPISNFMGDLSANGLYSGISLCMGSVFFALTYVPKRLIDLNGNVVCKPSSLIALDGTSLDDENEDNDV